MNDPLALPAPAPPATSNGNGVGTYDCSIIRRTRPQTFRKVANLLAEQTPIAQIMRLCRVSHGMVKAIATHEAHAIEERKKRVVSVLASVCEIGAERMEQKIGKSTLRDATIGTGVAVDKLLALTGQGAGVQVAIVNMPSDADREKQREIDDKLDAIFRALPSRE